MIAYFSTAANKPLSVLRALYANESEEASEYMSDLNKASGLGWPSMMSIRPKPAGSLYLRK